ncbi:MAG TPA: response regulator transcription factor [Thiotrichaceae bacterium]|jgi:DNA-binding NarL/FixJ family response regulator|nr:response regulator transcription factor [Thiotrichaceae bacterium]HIM08862.1 response regulator transcription factor [Gammaproteobacteria bacterium]
MSGKRILVVDDDHTTANVMQLYLENFGFIVPEITHSGAKAIEKAKELKPDLVLMDIRLGKGLDGIDSAEAIMKELNIPVIYVTAYNDEETLARAQLTNPYGFINKPLRDTDLKTTIRFALDKNKKNPAKKDSPLLEDVLHQVYSLTPAESRVVSKLLDNPDVESVADALHISISTVRTHLKHIYRKTETNRQSSLFHKIITGPVAMIMRTGETEPEK